MALGGFGQGFASGLESGASVLEARARQQALQQENMRRQLENYSSIADSTIKGLQDWITNAPQRTPELENAVNAQAAQLEDLASGLSTPAFGEFGKRLGDSIRQRTQMALQTKTKSEQASAEMQGDIATANQLAGAFGGQQQPGATPAQPAMPQATPTPDQQQVASAAPAATPLPWASQSPATAPAAPPEAQPAAPAPAAPTGGLTEQAQAAEPTAPDQAAQPVGTVPAMNFDATPGEGMTMDNVPPKAIEILLTSPTPEAVAHFKQTFGVDPSALLNAGSEKPSSPITAQSILRAKYKIPDPVGDAYAKKDAEQLVKNQTTIKENRQVLVQNLEARKQLERGVFSGLGAQWSLDTARAWVATLDKMGLSDYGAETRAKVNATERFMTNRIKSMSKMLKQFGAGTGISDADREVAWKAVGGDITLNEQTLKDIVDIESKMAIWTMAHPADAVPMTPEEIKQAEEQYGIGGD